jgi:hypothetical protein
MMKVHGREKYSVTKYLYGTTKYMPGVPETPPDHCRVKTITITKTPGHNETHNTVVVASYADGM